MITGKILSFFVSIVSAVLGVLPTVPVPSWLSSSSSAFSTVFQAYNSMGVWFPTALLMTVLTAYFTIKGISFAIKLTRMVASFLTGGGGSAA